MQGQELVTYIDTKIAFNRAIISQKQANIEEYLRSSVISSIAIAERVAEIYASIATVYGQQAALLKMRADAQAGLLTWVPATTTEN